MGKIVGGTNKLNNMIYARGHPQDFSTWWLQNKTDFNYTKDVLPHFEKLEKSISLSEIPHRSNLSDAIMLGLQELGLEANNDSHSFTGTYLIMCSCVALQLSATKYTRSGLLSSSGYFLP